MAIDTLTIFPDSFFAGDTVKVRFAPGEFLAPDWDLLTTFSGPEQFSVAAVDDDTGHLLTLTPADTEDKTPGIYGWSAVVSAAGERQTVKSGSVWIKPDPATGVLTYAEECLTLIEAHIKGRLPQGLLSHSIAGNPISKMSLLDMEKLRDKYRAEVAAEQRAAIAEEGGDPDTLQIEFTRR